MSRIYDFLPNGPDFMAGKQCYKANTANTVNAVTQKLFMHPLLLDIAIFIVSTQPYLKEEVSTIIFQPLTGMKIGVCLQIRLKFQVLTSTDYIEYVRSILKCSTTH